MNPGVLGATVAANSNAGERNHNSMYFVPYVREPESKIQGCINVELNKNICAYWSAPDVIDIKFKEELGIAEIDRLINKLHKLRDSMMGLMEADSQCP